MKRLCLFALFVLPAGPTLLAGQVPDTTRADSGAVKLETIEVVGSIAPTAGPEIGSGIPARISTVTGEQIDAWEPRLLADALATQPGISLYDDLGSAVQAQPQHARLQRRPGRRAAARRLGVPRRRAPERARRGGGELRPAADGARAAGSSC